MRMAGEYGPSRVSRTAPSFASSCRPAPSPTATRSLGGCLLDALVGRALDGAAIDAPGPVRLALHLVIGQHGDAVGPHHIDPLDQPSLDHAELAELHAARAVDWLIGAADHLHEGLGIVEDLLDGGRGVVEGRCLVVP